MSQRKTLYQWAEQLAHQLAHLSKPQAFVLAAFSLGVALAKSCTLSSVAQALAQLGKPDSVERRLQRFLSNQRLDWQLGCQALSAWVLSSLNSQGLIVLLVDETSLKDHLRVMVVSLAYRGRAIPLAWWCYPDSCWPMGQVELITTLLSWVAKGVPKTCNVLVEADRGIGCSPELLKAIGEFGYYYLMRVQRQVRLILDDGREVAFSSLVPKAGSRFGGWVYAFKKAGWLRCWAVGCWKARQDEPWLLVTNYPAAQGSWYGQRMWQEEAFKDFKSNGWEWQRSHVWQAAHANVLWLVMALAYVWVMSLGTQVIRDGALRKELTRGRAKRRSVFHLGLRYLSRWIALRRKLSFVLVLIPHLPVFS